jgi:hypothetical protein
VRADPRDAGEKRGHEEESLHWCHSVWGLLRIETPNPAVLIHRRVKPTGRSRSIAITPFLAFLSCRHTIRILTSGSLRLRESSSQTIKRQDDLGSDVVLRLVGELHDLRKGRRRNELQLHFLVVSLPWPTTSG